MVRETEPQQQRDLKGVVEIPARPVVVEHEWAPRLGSAAAPLDDLHKRLRLLGK